MRPLARDMGLFVAALALPLAGQTTKSLGPSAPVVQATAPANGIAVAAVPTPAATGRGGISGGQARGVRPITRRAQVI